jgi:hypothetical protein
MALALSAVAADAQQVPHNLASIVDASGFGEACRVWVADCGKAATIIHEAVRTTAVPIVSDDLTRVVDAPGIGAERRAWVVDRGEDAAAR